MSKSFVIMSICRWFMRILLKTEESESPTALRSVKKISVHSMITMAVIMTIILINSDSSHVEQPTEPPDRLNPGRQDVHITP